METHRIVGATEEEIKQFAWARELNPNKYKRPIRMLTGGGGEDVNIDVRTPLPAENNGMGTAVVEVSGPAVHLKDAREVVLNQVKRLTHRINSGLAGDIPQC